MAMRRRRSGGSRRRPAYSSSEPMKKPACTSVSSDSSAGRSSSAGLEQREQGVAQELGAGIKSLAKGPVVHRQYGAARACRAARQAREHRGEQVGILVPQPEAMGHGSAERANAELQRAAVGDEAGDVHARGIVRRRNLPVRQRKQRMIDAGPVEHEIEIRDGQLRIAGHVRQGRIDLSDECGRPPVTYRAFAAGDPG